MGFALLGGFAASALFNKKTSAATIAPPKPPPQASKAPDAAGVLKSQQGAGQAGGAPGVAQTFLTGAGGIDPALLQLGKTTLLGG
jgi:hypothetical protein